MMKIRLSEDRELAQHGWLESRHTFSFANYYDPRFTGFRSLIVINEDRVDPGHGFGRHSHADMEILSYVIEGALEHKDSTGSGSILKPGDVQIISAGTGIAHSEFNASKSEAVHFLQIWMVPGENGLKPGYAEKHFSDEAKTNTLKLIGSKSGREGSVKIHQDIDLYASILEPGKSLELPLRQGRGAWLQLIYGALKLNGSPMKSGDGLAVDGEKTLSITADFRSEFLLFDIA
ncbi:MAG TPA: pirin family protein [bacterium]|jgi:redox-sensitive bicupin YhaK (pirin superfamily)|nr:pirin family protein [bacterium]